MSGGVQSAVLPWASSLRLTESTAGSVDVEVVRLLETSPSAVSDREFDDLSPGAEHLRDVPDSQLGTRLLGVALKGTRCEPLEPRCERDPDNPFRLIAIGDSTWLTDAFADQYPEQVALAANYVDWLAQTRPWRLFVPRERRCGGYSSTLRRTGTWCNTRTCWAYRC